MQRANSPRGPLAIVGGTYYERCVLPFWNELYGSGLRAAAALANRGVAITLHTIADQPTAAVLRTIAASLRFKAQVGPIASTPGFTYLHPLAEPVISGLRGSAGLQDHPTQIDVQADKALVFGLIEATAKVEAEMAVYDPQSPAAPRPFSSNGSHARRLAVVANSQEAQALTGRASLDEAGRQLLAQERAEVVVVKDGPRGAMVFTQAGAHHVAAYQTRSTFSIGSGDIFSAVFAFEWMVSGLPVVQAAEQASLATAWYCQTRNLPLPVTLPDAFHLGPHLQNAASRRKVYLAGPFFDLMQHLCVQEVRGCLLRLGLDVFSPFHDVGTTGSASALAQADLMAMEGCDLLFAIFDGHDPGTLFEIGYARAKKFPVVILVSNPGLDRLTMFEGTGCHVFADLASAVYAAFWIEVGQR